MFFPSNILRLLIQGLIALLFVVSAGALYSPANAADKPYNVDKRYLYVQPGQTLHSIVRKLYPEKASQWTKLSREIVRLNPNAFIDNDARRMIAGQRLVLPYRSVVKPAPIPPGVKKKVGQVVLARGNVLAIDAKKNTRRLKAGAYVFVGDRLITGRNGFLRLLMVDQARLDMRCSSVLVIEEYLLQDRNSRSVMNLLKGSMRKVTGTIGDWSDDIYELKTPLASVGVRGTEYALRVFQSRGCGGMIDIDDESLYLNVIEGYVALNNSAGKKVISAGKTVRVNSSKELPQEVEVEPGVIEPIVMTRQVVVKEEGSGTNWWWVGLGLIALALAL